MPLGEQLVLEGMPVRLYSATPSRISGYLDCPRRYRMAYLQQPTPPRGAPWGHNAIGSAVHSALAKWWDLPLRTRTPEAGGDLVVRGWLTDGFRDRAQYEAARERARGYVERYLEQVDPTHEPLGVEVTVSVNTPRAALWGRADRIDDRPGDGVVVVDYKTGRSVPGEDDARSSLALALYAAAADADLPSAVHPCRAAPPPERDGRRVGPHPGDARGSARPGRRGRSRAGRARRALRRRAVRGGGRRALPRPGGVAVRLVRLPPVLRHRTLRRTREAAVGRGGGRLIEPASGGRAPAAGPGATTGSSGRPW